MDRKTLIEKIKLFTETNNLHSTQFAVAGSAASFLLNDCEEFRSITVEIALSGGFVGEIKTVNLGGLHFQCNKDHAAWASITEIPETKVFVVSTRGRKRK